MTIASSKASSEREIVITRLLDAPRELVFQVVTNPKHVAQWWGPRGFTNPVCEMDARPGGIWRGVMRSPEGVDYPYIGVFREIAPPERIVYTNNGFERDGAWTLKSIVTLTFEEQEGKTKLTIRSLFDSTEDRDAVQRMGHEIGTCQSLDRLAEYLTQQI